VSVYIILSYCVDSTKPLISTNGSFKASREKFKISWISKPLLIVSTQPTLIEYAPPFVPEYCMVAVRNRSTQDSASHLFLHLIRVVDIIKSW
jgi:hypothetical protein